MAELTTVYKCTNGANFPVQWQSPEDGQLNWVRDASHFPYPLTPLAVDFTRRVGEFMKTPGTGISGPGAVASLHSAMYARLTPWDSCTVWYLSPPSRTRICRSMDGG